MDTGPHSSFESLVSEIERVGYAAGDVRHVLLSHIHLDHAGAAWKFADQKSTVFVHPKGYRHLSDPSRLMASAATIFTDKMDRLWGTMKPIDDDHLRAVDDGQTITVGGCSFKALFTPGHARHHVAWRFEDSIFCGDVAGVRLPQGPILAPCPPPDLDFEAWQQSIRLLRQENPAALRLSHFGVVEQPERHLSALSSQLQSWKDWCDRQETTDAAGKESFAAGCERLIRSAFLDYGGDSKLFEEKYEIVNPIYMSVMGMAHYRSSSPQRG